jgi:uncharacterized protein YvpB
VSAAVALAAALSQSIGAAADTTLGVPLLSQQDPAWSGNRLGTSPTETVGTSGCAITSVVMMLNYYGISTDPAQINAWLTNNGGYAFDDKILWATIDTYTNGKVTFTGWLGPDVALIDNEIDAGRPVIAEVSLNGNQHFVILTGHDPNGFIMNDPWFNDRNYFSARYGDPFTGIVSIRTYMPQLPLAVRGGGRISWIANGGAAPHRAQ